MKTQTEKGKFLLLFHEFWKSVNEEDLSNLVDFNVLGKTVTLHQIEATLYGCLYEGAKVKLLYEKEDIVGFVLYHTIFNCVGAVRHMYIQREHWGNGGAKDMLNSIGVKKFIYQTWKKNPPVEFLNHVGKYSKKIDENDRIITWEIPWRTE